MGAQERDGVGRVLPPSPDPHPRRLTGLDGVNRVHGDRKPGPRQVTVVSDQPKTVAYQRLPGRSGRTFP